MTQIEWRTFEKGDAAALAALFRDAVMQLTLACYDTAARLAWASAADEADVFAARLAGTAVLTADVSLCAAHCFARAGFQVPGEEVVERNGVSLRRFRMHKPLDAAPPRR